MYAIKAPLVSVVIPCFNHREFIGEAIESVLGSSMQEFEIIVVDDGSVDNSADIVRRFRDPRIRLFSQPNRGAHAAMNRGVEMAAAEWIAFLNSDDRYHPTKLERHLKAHAKETELEASASRITYIGQSGTPLDRNGHVNLYYEQLKNSSHGPTTSLKCSLLVANHLVTTSALFISKRVFEEMGGFIPLRYVHDWFFFLTLAGRGGFQVLEEELVDYRIHGRNTIREDDDRGRVEDNFVLQWQLFNDPKRASWESLLDRLALVLEKNNRASLHLMFLFRLWSEANEDDLARCAAPFQDPQDPLIQTALDLIRDEKKESNLKLGLREFLGEELWALLAHYKAKKNRFLGNFSSSVRSPGSQA
jgi:glycosyltransferase involved in cell wall biosynthesis